MNIRPYLCQELSTLPLEPLQASPSHLQVTGTLAFNSHTPRCGCPNPSHPHQPSRASGVFGGLNSTRTLRSLLGVSTFSSVKWH